MSYIKLSGSVLAASSSAAGTYELGVSEFQMLDGLAAGTVQASKLVVVDASKDITGYGSVTGSGDIFFANAVLSGDLRLDDDLTVGDDAAIGGDLDVTGDMTSATITMSEFTVAANGNTDIDGTLNVEGIPTFQAQSVHSAGGTFNSAGLAACGVIAGATTIDASGDLTVGTITMAEFTVDGSGNTDVDGTLNVEGVPTFQAAAVFSGGITTANAIAGATTVSGSGAFSMSAIDNDGALNNRGVANIVGKLSVTAVSDLDGGINVSDTLTVSAAGALAGATTISGSSTISGHALDIETTADLGGKLTVVGVSDLDGGINVSDTFTVSAAGAVAGATTVSGSGLFSMNEIDNDGALNNRGVANIVGKLTVTAVSDLDGGIDVNASKFTVSAGGAMLASSAKIADISNGGIVFGSGGDGELSVDAGLGWNSGASTLAATNVSCSANLMAKGTLSANGEANLYGLTTNVHRTFNALGDTNLGNASADVTTLVGQASASAGLHISAKSGPYALSVADGAGDAIAQAWVTHSDRNLKTNIQELDNNAALNAVMSLQPSTYEKKATGKSEIGFIAQEVAQVVPEICALDANGEGRGIDYSRMSTLLAGALKAQQEQIAQLKEIVAKLQK